MSDPAVPLTLGSRILTADGYAVVTDLERQGCVCVSPLEKTGP